MVFYYKARPDAGDYTIYMGADKNEELIKYGLPEDVWFHVDKVSSAHVYLRLKKGDSVDAISEGLLEDCAQLVKAHSIQGNKMNNVEVVYTPWSNLKKAPSMDVGQVGFHNPRLVSSAHVYLRLKKGDSIDAISEGLLEDCAQLVKAHSIQGNKMNNVEVVYTPWSNLKKAPSMDVGQVGFHNPRLVHILTVEKRVNEILNRLHKTRVERRPDLKAEKDASNAAEKAERKMQLKDKKRREEMERLVKERQAEIRSYKGLMVAEKMTSNRQIASAGKSMQEVEDDFV